MRLWCPNWINAAQRGPPTLRISCWPLTPPASQQKRFRSSNDTRPFQPATVQKVVTCCNLESYSKLPQKRPWRSLGLRLFLWPSLVFPRRSTPMCSLEPIDKNLPPPSPPGLAEAHSWSLSAPRPQDLDALMIHLISQNRAFNMILIPLTDYEVQFQNWRLLKRNDKESSDPES